jgi:hypothetical protein
MEFLDRFVAGEFLRVLPDPLLVELDDLGILNQLLAGGKGDVVLPGVLL